MMTGDSYRTAEAIARQVGVDQFFAEVLPEDKANFVQKAKAEGHTVVMIGDGINDSPPFRLRISASPSTRRCHRPRDRGCHHQGRQPGGAGHPQDHRQCAAAPCQLELPLRAQLQLHPHRAGGSGHPAARRFGHAAQPVHHRHQPPEHDEPHPESFFCTAARRLTSSQQQSPCTYRVQGALCFY